MIAGVLERARTLVPSRATWLAAVLFASLTVLLAYPLTLHPAVAVNGLLPVSGGMQHVHRLPPCRRDNVVRARQRQFGDHERRRPGRQPSIDGGYLYLKRCDAQRSRKELGDENGPGDDRERRPRRVPELRR